jgi:hypothetical protein
MATSMLDHDPACRVVAWGDAASAPAVGGNRRLQQDVQIG